MKSVAGTSGTGRLELEVRVTGGEPTDKVVEIYQRVLPDVLETFANKAADYKAEAFFTADLLGVRGQFADMWRKFGKLYSAMWEGNELDGEQPEEILADLIGHALLSLDMYARQREAEQERRNLVVPGYVVCTVNNAKECIIDECPVHG